MLTGKYKGETVSKTYIPVALRELVSNRSDGSCEYCRINQMFSGLSFQIDHIISETHGGETTPENLAYSCAVCNHLKHANLAAYLPELKRAFILFHPRVDVWVEHFTLEVSGKINFLSDSGKATGRLLRMNREEAVEERRLQLKLGIIQVSK